MSKSINLSIYSQLSSTADRHATSRWIRLSTFCPTTLRSKTTSHNFREVALLLSVFQLWMTLTIVNHFEWGNSFVPTTHGISQLHKLNPDGVRAEVSYRVGSVIHGWLLLMELSNFCCWWKTEIATESLRTRIPLRCTASGKKRNEALQRRSMRSVGIYRTCKWPIYHQYAAGNLRRWMQYLHRK